MKFNAANDWIGGEWPLKAGTSWKAFLLHTTTGLGGFAIIASSATFTICDGVCGGPTSTAVNAAKSDITALITKNKKLAAKFLRLSFHDCVGGCDGCVDLTDSDNNGLLIPIKALQPVVSAHESSQTGLTRADIWSLAGLVGADVSKPKTSTASFSFDSVGRVNCENANTVCKNKLGVQQACNATLGPGRIHPSMNLNSQQVLTFFSSNFGFSTKETGRSSFTCPCQYINE